MDEGRHRAEWKEKALNTKRMVSSYLTEPPDADPHVRWCGRGAGLARPPIPIVHYPSTNVKRINDGCRELTGRGREGIIHSTVATHF